MASTHKASDGLSLSAAKNGTAVRIRKMRGGHQFLSRLASLGFTPGAHIRVIRNHGRGPIIVSVRDARVALGRGEASKILVEEDCEGDSGPQH
jgi:ferrous iron transport protein A